MGIHQNCIRMWFTWCLLIGVVLGGSAGCNRRDWSTRMGIENALGVNLPKTAVLLNSQSRIGRNFGIVEIWAVFEVSLSNSQDFAELLCVDSYPMDSTMLPRMKPNPSWWVQDSDRSAIASNQWLGGHSDYRPGTLSLWWSRERLFVHFLGVPGSGKRRGPTQLESDRKLQGVR